MTTVTLWDANWNRIGELTPTGEVIPDGAVGDVAAGVKELTLPADHAAAAALLAAASKDPEQLLTVTVDNDGERWSGRVAMWSLLATETGRQVTLQCVHAEHRSGLDKVLDSLSGVRL